MDVDHVRLDLHSEFTVLRVVFGNDVPISTTDIPHNDSRRLRHCALGRSFIVVHILAAKGDWLLRVRDLDSRFVRGYAKMAADCPGKVDWGRERRGQTLVPKSALI